jgi:hypothetical protein
MANRLRALAIWMTILGTMTGCEGAPVDRDLSAGPIITNSPASPGPWCEDLEAQGIMPEETGDECVYKYLDNGIKYWPLYASVAFVADVRPDCDGGVQRFCQPSEFGEDCLEICPMKVGRISATLFGNPDAIESLATFGPETWQKDGETVNAYLVDGQYPSSHWTISAGYNLIFAHRECYASRYVGYDGLFLVTGIYPVEGDVVFDADEVSTTIQFLNEEIGAMGVTEDETEDYSRRCLFGNV